jgi:hypothetical protein
LEVDSRLSQTAITALHRRHMQSRFLSLWIKAWLWSRLMWFYRDGGDIRECEFDFDDAIEPVDEGRPKVTDPNDIDKVLDVVLEEYDLPPAAAESRRQRQSSTPLWI